ncbi:hypothetical protein OOT46_12505 [Aquabacterium sp. A7-Y]|uniref:hypothetical protein n=1 Tax=Aquabacterium sp. A7-Y TaxID=1349605 RepID=UPI00223E18D4|nr:hypothetical protein [Aquabacterium sp. A7-Y]MCW7538664.1 hypothetical protein [Aquabacterium sp. A7-Y]
MTVVPVVLKLDWESGEGRVEVGEAFAEAHARFRRDVLADWKDEIERLLQQAEDALDPQRADQEIAEQRQRNLQRRRLCEELGGQTIKLAEPLVNGDVLMHLSDGRSVVLYAYDEDVKLERVDPLRARLHAQKACAGDVYVREDPPERPTPHPEAAPVLAS